MNIKSEEFRKALVINAIANKSFNKIFCIGYNKTGTTTLEETLRFYGYSLPLQKQQEARLSKNVFDTNYVEFLSFVQRYDAFQDMPFSQGLTFVAADALFPNSKFILSVRDSEAWFQSLKLFHMKKNGIDSTKISEKDILEKFTYLYDGYGYENKKRFLTTFKNNKYLVDWTKLYDQKYYIEQYEQRNNLIQKYFVNAPNKLLVIDVTKEATTEKLCEFLNIPKEFVIAMPQRNKN